MVNGVQAAIALGSNLGDRAAHLNGALEAIASLPEMRVLAVSGFIETEPLPRPDGGDAGGPYLNAAATLRTRLPARQLLDSLLAIERRSGRIRGEAGDAGAAGGKWAPRTLDLDLLTYGDDAIQEEGLTVPHPRLHERAFVLVPLAEIAPDLRLGGPYHGRTVAQLLAALRQGCPT